MRNRLCVVCGGMLLCRDRFLLWYMMLYLWVLGDCCGVLCCSPVVVDLVTVVSCAAAPSNPVAKMCIYAVGWAADMEEGD